MTRGKSIKWIRRIKILSQYLLGSTGRFSKRQEIRTSLEFIIMKNTPYYRFFQLSFIVLQVTEMAQTANKVKSMFDLVFDPSKESEKRRKAADNLVYLAKDKAGAENLFKEGSVQQIAKLMKIEKDHNIRLSLIR